MTRLQADIRTLGKILRCLKREMSIPQELEKHPVYTSIEQPNARRVGNKLRELQQRLNKKAEKRTTIRARMYKYNRSEHFRTRNYGAFLNSALSKFNNFQGIEEFSTTTVDGSRRGTSGRHGPRMDQTNSLPQSPTTTFHTIHTDTKVLQDENTGRLGCDGPLVQKDVSHNTHTSAQSHIRPHYGPGQPCRTHT